jgi:hypothetical protein
VTEHELSCPMLLAWDLGEAYVRCTCRCYSCDNTRLVDCPECQGQGVGREGFACEHCDGKCFVECPDCEELKSNLLTRCRNCGGVLMAAVDSCHHGVRCLECGSFYRASDYIARCVGGASIAAAQPRFEGEVDE